MPVMKSTTTQWKEVCALSAIELARRISSRKLTARAALDAHLACIEGRNPQLNAVVSLDIAGARRQADAVDAAIARRADVGPLHGVPMTLKDGIDVAGLRTTIGTAAFDRLADEDATVAARLRKAGAIIIGHTNVAPLLADYQSANEIFGRTSNPWNVARTAGGSSGGAAAAVAAGMTPIEIVSDLGGSIRLPAHFCGVYGLKPTERRVPMTGFFRLPPGSPRTVRIMSSLGPLARTLDDLSIALGLISGPDGADTEIAPVPLGTEPAVRLADLRIAFAPAIPGATVASAIRTRVAQVAGNASNAGARVAQRLPHCDWDSANQLFRDLVTTVTAAQTNRPLDWYFSALDHRDRLMATWDEFFEDVDVLVMPAAMTVAFPHCDTGSPVTVDRQPAPYFGQGALLAMGNLTGLPSLVAPAGQDEDGLPIGVQLVGPRWSERRLIAICRALETDGVLPGFVPPPEPVEI